MFMCRNAACCVTEGLYDGSRAQQAERAEARERAEVSGSGGTSGGGTSGGRMAIKRKSEILKKNYLIFEINS